MLDDMSDYIQREPEFQRQAQRGLRDVMHYLDDLKGVLGVTKPTHSFSNHPFPLYF